MDFTDPADVVPAWMSAAAFLQRNAPRAWAAEMVDDRGIPYRHPPFYVPDSAYHLPVHAKAEYLAAAEYRRLAAAELYHLDAEATATALATPVTSSPDITTLPPAPSGLLTWATPVTTDRGAPLVALSWGPEEDGGLMMVWWSDSEAVAHRSGEDLDAVINSNGSLTYDRWARYVPGSRPDHADLRREPYELDSHVIPAAMATWTAMRAGRLRAVETLAPSSGDREQAGRMGLNARPVRCYRP
ncbi:hypothetical protein VSH64_15585 [Amycolatopsis rhabdoformis]|uniref:Uncharacterized protein n=1 Tax=Amycolatopsis rhabdoformis TaxID=1448059 RepID=A0ABZ1IGB4_9PSEU|nr:hypothetical protein [Amycolatopsis rhabdoformis]WSE33510.1 hypothetical protein VSH64_15585 [Amycolatopsis rhabdoformis]